MSVALGRARVAINGELGVGDVGRPSSGRVRAKPLSHVWKLIKKRRVTRGSFVGGEGSPGWNSGRI